MHAPDVYMRLEKDFVSKSMSDDWAQYMGEIAEYLSPNFAERSMGLVCDFAKTICKVYTAVFPSEGVMNKILEDGAADAMLFVHHAAVWDIRRTPVFYQMDKGLLEMFRERRISIFNFHVPLDNFGEFSTTKTLADALGIKIEKPFFEYRGALAGVFGRTGCLSVQELHSLFTKTLGHQTKLYQYGGDTIQGGRVALAAGGGNDLALVSEMLENGIQNLITGITAAHDVSAEVHAFERENRVNLLGGSHYSTEKFACQKMCIYFERLGLPAVFIGEEPLLEDM